MGTSSRTGFRNAVLAATAIAAICAAPAARAQAAAAQPAQAGVADYDIPAQPLASALTAFAQRSGVKLAYTASLSEGRSAPALKGSFTRPQALSRLLAGSGLSYRFSGASAVTIVETNAAAGGVAANVPGALALDTVNVEGANPNAVIGNLPPPYAGGQVASGSQLGFLGNRSIMDTPFNQTSYTSQLIQDQQARTLTDVFDNDPSVRSNNPLGGNGDESWYIRGFTVSTGNIGFNGLYGLSPPFAFAGINFVDRVELLKGPGALLTGMPPFGEIGGTINLVTKHAGNDPIAQLTTTYASNSLFGTNIDVGQRYGDNKEWGVRFNGALQGGDTSIDDQHQKLGSAALGLDYRGDRLRVSADFAYYNDRWTGATRNFTAFGLPFMPPAPNATLNQNPPWSTSSNQTSLAMVSAEYDLAQTTTVYASTGYTYNHMPFQGLNPNINDTLGNFSSDGETAANEARKNFALQAGVRSVFNTGPVEHAVNVNVATATQRYIEDQNDYPEGTTLISGNIYNPVFGPQPPILLSTPTLAEVSRQTSVGVGDTMSFLDKMIQLTVGVRRQYVLDNSYDATGSFVINGYRAAAWSPAFGLVVRPTEQISLYANFIEGLSEGQIVSPGFANAGQVFPASVSKQEEAGIKVDFGQFITTADVFQITQPAFESLPGTPLPTLSADGTNTNSGFEVNVLGKVIDQVRLLGGVVLYKSKLEGTPGGAQDGNRLAGIPDLQMNIGAEWDTPFLPGFTLTGRVIHTDRSFVDNENTLVLPAWTRVDIGARYTFTSPLNEKPIVVRFDVQNVLGANYWMANNFNSINIGSPRTYLVSTTFNF